MFDETKNSWGNLRLILFRFLFVYLVLYNFPSPISFFYSRKGIFAYYNDLWQTLVIWVGKTFFNLEIKYQFNGSGDTTHDYILLLCFFVISITITVCWTLIDKKRKNYARLNQFLQAYLRYVVGLTLVYYGTRKIIKSQFPTPWLERLLEPYGDSSPMALLWTFMGYSYSYNVFTGLGELIGGVLLIYKRTRVLGAIILIGIMSNVVMLNFSYDVPVKLYSTHLLLMTFFILMPDIKRLCDFFIFNNPTQPEVYQPLFAKPKLNRWVIVFSTILVCGFMVNSFYTSHQATKFFTEKIDSNYGIWNVEEIEIDGEIQEPLLTNE
ncbi:MAG: hypothetical protein MUC29_10365 [Pyrinomonadaceae bacterium]|jgi:uncharacterized membrane protein YphA (DoxX/SURF4 family)|nr:hypothetical protein [Pyrinomonadaceae bacterium]